MIGKIVSNKMTGTVAVEVERVKTHPLYGKRLKRGQKFLAKSDEKLNLGDSVEIKEVRPISRRVKFVVIKILGRAEVLPEISQDVAKEKTAPKKRGKDDSNKK